MKLNGKRPVNVLARITKLADDSNTSEENKRLVLGLARLAIDETTAEDEKDYNQQIIDVIHKGISKSIKMKRATIKHVITNQDKEEKRVKDLIKHVQIALKNRS